MTPFSIVDAYSMSSTNNNPFQTNTSLNATATSSQTSHKPHTDPKTSPSASLPSSSVVFTKQATNKCPVTAQSFTLAFVAMNKSVKTSDGREHQIIPEKLLYQVEPHMNFTMGDQPPDLVAYNQWHEPKKGIKVVLYI